MHPTIKAKLDKLVDEMAALCRERREVSFRGDYIRDGLSLARWAERGATESVYWVAFPEATFIAFGYAPRDAANVIPDIYLGDKPIASLYWEAWDPMKGAK